MPVLVVEPVNYGLRGFSISGPRLWNTLPHDIRQSVGNLNLFKNKLKTYFFSIATASIAPLRILVTSGALLNALLHYITTDARKLFISHMRSYLYSDFDDEKL